jgi:hypothetical protein
MDMLNFWCDITLVSEVSNCNRVINISVVLTQGSFNLRTLLNVYIHVEESCIGHYFI